MTEKKELLIRILDHIISDLSLNTSRTPRTLLTKYKMMSTHDWMTEKQIDEVMILQVPTGKECTRCPHLKKDLCTFLNIKLYRAAKACNYNL